MCRHLAQIVDIVIFPKESASELTWQGLTCSSVAFPCIIIASLNAYNLWNEHWEHWETLPPLEERVEYSYQNIRTKAFPWGDGDKVSISLR